MAGHNFSRYMLSLWSALFAPFNFLFAYTWPFFTRATEANDTVSLLLPKASPSPPASLFTPPTPAPTPKPDASATAAATPATATATLPATSPVHGQHLSHASRSIAGEDQLNHAVANDINSEDDADLHLLPQDSRQHQSINMTRKRTTGRGRGGAKSSIHQPMSMTPVPPVADTAQGWPAPSGQSDTSASGDTSFIPSHPNGHNFPSFKRGGNQARNGNSYMPQQQPIDNKENVIPPSDDDALSRSVSSGFSPPTPLFMHDKFSEPQKPGARSRLADDSVSGTSAIDTMCDGSSASYVGAEQLYVLADRLTLEDKPSSQQPVPLTLNEATATAEASALPVPLIVAVPVPLQLQAAQPAQPAQPGPETTLASGLPGLIEPTTEEGRAEREYHLRFMREALDMGDLALKTNETPVGCVLVYRGRVIARGMNATNVTRNGTRHAEFMALSALLSRREPCDVKMTDDIDFDDASWGDVDPKDGHIFPYGQKLHPAPVVDRSIISECVLYVTVEPCVMCASLLRQLSIKKVYFGAVNDKFGGTGGVFRVHMNSKPVPIPGDRPYQQGYGPQDLSLISKGRALALPRDDDEGDGGNVEPGYPVEGGYLRDDAVSLLRRFYVQENGRAPQPRKKEGRAARLYAAMENQNRTVNASDLSDNTPETPVEAEAPMALSDKPDIAI